MAKPDRGNRDRDRDDDRRPRGAGRDNIPDRGRPANDGRDDNPFHDLRRAMNTGVADPKAFAEAAGLVAAKEAGDEQVDVFRRYKARFAAEPKPAPRPTAPPAKPPTGSKPPTQPEPPVVVTPPVVTPPIVTPPAVEPPVVVTPEPVPEPPVVVEPPPVVEPPKPPPVVKNSLNRVDKGGTLRDGEVVEGRLFDGCGLIVPSSNAVVRYCEFVRTPLGTAAVYVGDKADREGRTACPGVELHHLAIHENYGWGIRIGAPNARGTKVHDIHFYDWRVNPIPKGMKDGDARAQGYGPDANMREKLQLGTGIAGSRWELECEAWNILIQGLAIDLEDISIKALKVFLHDVDNSASFDPDRPKKRGWIMNRHGGPNRIYNVRGRVRALDGPVDVRDVDEFVVVYGNVPGDPPREGYPQPHSMRWARIGKFSFDETDRPLGPLDCEEDASLPMLGAGARLIQPDEVGVARWLAGEAA